MDRNAGSEWTYVRPVRTPYLLPMGSRPDIHRMPSVTRDVRDLQHDLRTHLTVMTGFADLLTRPGDLSEEARRDYASRILSAVMEIRDIVDELED